MIWISYRCICWPINSSLQTLRNTAVYNPPDSLIGLLASCSQPYYVFKLWSLRSELSLAHLPQTTDWTRLRRCRALFLKFFASFSLFLLFLSHLSQLYFSLIFFWYFLSFVTLLTSSHHETHSSSLPPYMYIFLLHTVYCHAHLHIHTGPGECDVQRAVTRLLLSDQV